MTVPPKVLGRVKAGLRRLRPILKQQKSRDVSEADTVTLVKEVLSQVLGYDKFTEVTGQYQVRGQFCDLAIKVEESLTHLIEVKAIGVALNDRHLQQVLAYATNEGVEWVVLTNGITWQLYSVIFGKPIGTRLVAEFDVMTVDPANPEDAELLFVFTKEGAKKGAHTARKAQLEALDRHLLAALILRNRRVLSTLCSELRRVVKVRVEPRDLPRVLEAEVVKRDVLESPAYAAAVARVGGGKAVDPIPVKLRPVARTKATVPGSLVELIRDGALTAPLPLSRKYKGKTLTATLREDGTVEIGGTRYPSPSTAANMARRTVTGRDMHTNGWSFWQYKDVNGDLRTLADARSTRRESRGSAKGA